MSEPVYTTEADVTVNMPDDWDDALSHLDITAAIATASRMADAAFSTCWKFNDITATIKPPAIVQEYTRQRARALLMIELRTSNADTNESMSGEFDEAADRIAKRFQSGIDSIPEDTVTDETISWGSNTWYPDEHVFSVAPRDVIPGSVRITGYRNGIDFQCQYRHDIRAWTMSGRGSLGASTKVSYEFSHYRRVDIERPGHDSISLEIC
jgi:hypothetical protein